MGGTDPTEPGRNHFDRFVHFTYGVLMIPASIELLDRVLRREVFGGGCCRCCSSHPAIYEILEGIAAMVVAPELGEAYLNTQGDQRDAQRTWRW